MASLNSLPDDMVIQIITCGVLNAQDVLNVSQLSTRFNKVCATNTVWKRLCLDKWPHLLRNDGKLTKIIHRLDIKLDKNSISDFESVPEWLLVYQQINAIFVCLRKIFSQYFYEYELDDEVYCPFLEIVNKYTYEFVSTVLFELNSVKCKTADLTDKYYAKKVYHFLHCNWLKPQLKALLESDNDDIEPVADSTNISSLLKATILIDCWFNSSRSQEIDSAFVTDFIKSAARKTLQHLELTGIPNENDHDILIQFKLKSLNHVFFEELKFHGNEGDYFNVNNSYIHEVIKTRKGIPILLSIIYREIAGRIGLKLQCVNNPGHFVLRYQVNELQSNKPSASQIARSYQYIDVYNNGRILDSNELPLELLRIKNATINEVLHRVSLNVEAHTRITGLASMNDQPTIDALNLCLLIDPDSHRVRSKRMMIYYSKGINLSQMVEDNRSIPDEVRTQLSLRSMEIFEKAFLEKIKREDMRRKNYKPTIALRSNPDNRDVRYSVGMVMHHHRYDYICVIRGWNNFCDMPTEWIEQMGVHSLERGPNQPFYHVLVDKDGSERYAAEDSLEVVAHQPEVDHSEIGHYFCETHSAPVRHYVPNSQLQFRYPEDMASTLDQISEL